MLTQFDTNKTKTFLMTSRSPNFRHIDNKLEMQIGNFSVHFITLRYNFGILLYVYIAGIQRQNEDRLEVARFTFWRQVKWSV